LRGERSETRLWYWEKNAREEAHKRIIIIPLSGPLRARVAPSQLRLLASVPLRTSPFEWSPANARNRLTIATPVGQSMCALFYPSEAGILVDHADLDDHQTLLSVEPNLTTIHYHPHLYSILRGQHEIPADTLRRRVGDTASVNGRFLNLRLFVLSGASI
jgi:hypothetical protein